MGFRNWGGSGLEDSEQEKPETSADKLTEISGIESATVNILRESGIETVQDVQRKSEEEIADINGISDSLAARIKSHTEGAKEVEDDDIGEAEDDDGISPRVVFTELTRFQRDLLVIIVGIGPSSGLNIKDEIGTYYEENINHGRLYPNLNTLSEKNLIQKEAADARTNEYTLTEFGLVCLQARREWVESQNAPYEEAESGDVIPDPESSNSDEEVREDDAVLDDTKEANTDTEPIESEQTTNILSTDSDDPSDQKPTRTQLIEELQRLKTEKGNTVINSKHMRSEGAYSIHEYTTEFGSWDGALKAANINKKEILLEELAVIWQFLGREPKTTDLEKYSEFTGGMYTDHFESWSAAKEECKQEGIDSLDSEALDKDISTTGSDVVDAARTDTPSREALIEEIQRLEAQLGNKIINSRYITEEATYTVNEYTTEFGSWDEALAAAGIDKEAAFLEELARVWRKLGHRPNTVQMEEHSALGGGMYTSIFGTWEETLELCKKEYNLPSESKESKISNSREDDVDQGNSASEAPTRTELLTELRQLNEQFDHLVKATELADHSEFTQSQYESEFGSWDEALSAAGLDKREELLDELERVWKERGRQPTSSDMNQLGKYSASMYQRFFGGWSETIKAIKADRQVIIDTARNDASTDIGEDSTDSDSTENSAESIRADLINELQRLHNQLGVKIANSRYVNERGEYSLNDYVDEFGTWEESLDAADIDRESEFLKELARVWRELGEEPSTSQMQSHGELGPGLYSQQFGSWTDAKARCRKEYDLPGKPTKSSTEITSVNADSLEQPTNSRLSTAVRDSLATIEDVSANARLEKPILIQIQSIPEGQRNRKSRDIRIKGLTDETFSFVVWKVHEINIGWKEEHWYLLEEARGNVWEGGNTEHKQLSSTRDLRATDLGTTLSDKQLHNLLGLEGGDSNQQAEDNPEDEYESSDLVGSLMDDMDL